MDNAFFVILIIASIAARSLQTQHNAPAANRDMPLTLPIVAQLAPSNAKPVPHLISAPLAKTATTSPRKTDSPQGNARNVRMTTTAQHVRLRATFALLVMRVIF